MDSTFVCVEHLDREPVVLEPLAGLRDSAELHEDEATHGVEIPRADLDAQRLFDVLHLHLARNDDAVAVPLEQHPLGLVLVLDLADNLLHEVLEGDQPGGTAVLVDHDRDLLLA